MGTTLSCSACGGSLGAADQFCPRCGSANVGAAAYAATVLGSASPWDEIIVRLRGVTAGEFQILGELGRGGMACVYLAHDITLNRKVAIKVMAPGLLTGPGMVERFKQEAITVANLNHPHIVTIHSVRQAAGLHYFFMKLVPGASLERVIREVRPLSIPVVQALAYQVGSALAYGHRRNIVHRDVKPSNILLDDEGNAVVTDFGIAKVLESPSQTQTGTTVGTPAYMSPEQCWSREVSPASDQYSLGIVIYEMLTGRPPFSGPTLGILRAHTEDLPPPILDVRPECPTDLAAAVHRMLEKEPSRRWPAVMRAVEGLGGRQVHEDDPVREELVRLSALGPDHPLQLVPTPQSPIPVRHPSPPPPALESIEVRMRTAAPPPAAEPVPAVPVQQEAPRMGTTSLPRYWWAAPVALALLVVGWLLWPTSPAPPPPDRTLPRDTIARIDPANLPVASVELSGVPARVLVGDEFFLAATARGTQGDALPGRAVAWTSSRPAVARVSPTGVVTALRAGAATVTARVEAESAFVVLNVRTRRAATITLAPETVRIAVGDSVRIHPRLLNERGENAPGVVVWESLDPAVVGVSSSGMVVGRREGTGRVAAVADGIRREATVTVAAAPAPTPRPRPVRGNALLRMMVSPWANVTIDGQARGQRVRSEDTLSAGVAHRLQFSRQGYATIDTVVTLQPGERRLLKIFMKRRGT